MRRREGDHQLTPRELIPYSSKPTSVFSFGCLRCLRCLRRRPRGRGLVVEPGSVRERIVKVTVVPRAAPRWCAATVVMCSDHCGRRGFSNRPDNKGIETCSGGGRCRLFSALRCSNRSDINGIQTRRRGHCHQRDEPWLPGGFQDSHCAGVEVRDVGPASVRRDCDAGRGVGRYGGSHGSGLRVDDRYRIGPHIRGVDVTAIR